MSAARAVSRVKPIIAVKAGRTQAGAKAAATHTGSLAGEDAVYDAAFERAGIVRVKTFEELFDCAELLGQNSRGLWVRVWRLSPMRVDWGSWLLMRFSIMVLTRLLYVPKPSGNWMNSFHLTGAKQNPIDILGDATPERYQRVVEILPESF